MGVLRVAWPEAGPWLRTEARLRALVALGAVVLTVHLLQHVADGIPPPKWFFALGVIGAAGLWATAALWPRGSEVARTVVLAILGVGLAWGGLAEHAADAAADGLTATHATGIAAGVIGVALLAIAASRIVKGPGPSLGSRR